MTKIKDLIPYQKNPRILTEKQHDLLRDSLDEFGDLSGVVFNKSLGFLVGGHIRMEIFKKGYTPKLMNITRLDKPDAQGTVSYGWIQITINGEYHRHSFREVEWDQEKHDEACIKANRLGGGWDRAILASEWSQDKLLDWGFEELDFGISGNTDIDFSDKNKEIDMDELSEGGILKLQYTDEDYLKVIALLNRVRNSHESNEAIIYRLLKDNESQV